MSLLHAACNAQMQCIADCRLSHPGTPKPLLYDQPAVVGDSLYSLTSLCFMTITPTCDGWWVTHCVVLCLSALWPSPQPVVVGDSLSSLMSLCFLCKTCAGLCADRSYGHLKGTPSQDPGWSENVDSMTLWHSLLLAFCFCSVNSCATQVLYWFKFKLRWAEPCWSTLYQCWTEKGWVLTS